MVNFGPLTAEIDLRAWSTPANLNRFRVFASLLQRRRSLEANQTVHDVWPSSELVHYTPWAIKSSQLVFVCNFVKNQRILMQFSCTLRI